MRHPPPRLHLGPATAGRGCRFRAAARQRDATAAARGCDPGRAGDACLPAESQADRDQRGLASGAQPRRGVAERGVVGVL